MRKVRVVDANRGPRSYQRRLPLRHLPVDLHVGGLLPPTCRSTRTSSSGEGHRRPQTGATSPPSGLQHQTRQTAKIGGISDNFARGWRVFGPASPRRRSAPAADGVENPCFHGIFAGDRPAAAYPSKAGQYAKMPERSSAPLRKSQPVKSLRAVAGANCSVAKITADLRPLPAMERLPHALSLNDLTMRTRHVDIDVSRISFLNYGELRAVLGPKIARYWHLRGIFGSRPRASRRGRF